MNRKSLSCAGAAAALLLAAGCGSSGKSTTAGSNASAPASGTTASTAASSGGAYGRTPASGASSGGAGLAISTKHGKLGTILAAGPKHMTVYLFEADKGGASACSGACAAAWPPVTTSGTPSAGGQAVSGDLGTIARADGTEQVTYKGHPLYFFVRDKDSGDAYGQGVKAFGASWYMLKPDGAKLDNS